MNRKVIITEHLHNVGCKPSYMGYDMLRNAIDFCLAEPDLLRGNYSLLDFLGRLYRIPGKTVERRMAYVIMDAHADSRVLQAEFSDTPNVIRFIKYIVEKVKRQERGEYGMDIREEIEQAKQQLAIARNQYDHATGRYIDIAAKKVSVCEEYLDALLEQAKQEWVSA